MLPGPSDAIIAPSLGHEHAGKNECEVGRLKMEISSYYRLLYSMRFPKLQLKNSLDTIPNVILTQYCAKYFYIYIYILACVLIRV